ERVAQLARVYGAAEDAISDDIVARLADSASEGLDLVDQLNRSGLKRALPVLTRLVDNGDLERVAQLARVFGAAEDALSDDVVARLAEIAADGLSLVDRANRCGAVRILDLLADMEASGRLERLAASLGRLADRTDQLERLLSALDYAATETANHQGARGGFGGLLSLVRPAENQEALRHLMNIGKALASAGASHSMPRRATPTMSEARLASAEAPGDRTD
ncbi:MAG: hypothetical protein KJZ80_12030, partial [Hyphomicrobiaceae bacterium]|nr:hypothetical protein [Hyphomicrobiaceae bacterium]